MNRSSRNSYMREWRKNNVEKEKENKRKAYVKQQGRWIEYSKNRNNKLRGTPKQRYIYGKGLAKYKGKSWTLTFEQYETIINMPCYYCNSILTGSGVGLDRIENSKGYELNNVLSCCGECNYTRGNRYTVKETKVMIDALIKFRNSNLE